MDTTPSISGYERHGEWLVSAKDKLDVDRLGTTPPPRPFGLIDQLKLDLSTEPSRTMWAIIAGATVLAIVTWSIIPAVFAAVAGAFFGRAFLDTVRTARHGVLSTARIGHIEHANRLGGTNDNVVVDGIRMKINFDSLPVRAILDSGHDVEMRVIYLPKRRKLLGHAFAYRAIRRSEHGSTIPTRF